MKTIKKQFRGNQSRWYVAEQYVGSFCSRDDCILDLGYRNQFSDIMRENNYNVTNTIFDLDTNTENLKMINGYKIVTAFEIFEHLVNSFGVLRALKTGTKLICSVPLRVWFAKPHWNDDDPLDQHYHEFLQREFEILLKKAGYEIVFLQKECIAKNFGIRQLITWLFGIKRYLFAVAVKVR